MLNDPLIVEFVVTIKIADHGPDMRVDEARLEQQTLASLKRCLGQQKALRVQSVNLLGIEHCEWVFESGMPVDCGLAQPVRLFCNGSWSYPYRGEIEDSDDGFYSLMQFVDENAV